MAPNLVIYDQQKYALLRIMTLFKVLYRCWVSLFMKLSDNQTPVEQRGSDVNVKGEGNYTRPLSIT